MEVLSNLLFNGTSGTSDQVLTSNGSSLQLWEDASGGSVPTPYSETPTGLVNGSNTVYTLANTPANSNGVIIVIDQGVYLNGIDYTVSGTTVTMNWAPATGSTIHAYYNTLTGGGGGGALSDGDYGDIIVSSTGAAINIDKSITPTWLASHIFRKDALGTTATAGITLDNTTAAAPGAQQVSPSLVLEGRGWRTTATAASRPVAFRNYVLPIEGTTNPAAAWTLQSSLNNLSYVHRLSIRTDDSMAYSTATASNIGAVALSLNSTASGLNSFTAGGQNSVASGQGAVSVATDSYAVGNYSFVANDANGAYGTSSAALGFGNFTYDENGFVAGNDNIAGALSGAGTNNAYTGSTIFGVQNRTTGNRTFVAGRAVAATAADAFALGNGVDATNTRMTNSEAQSFAVGFNSTVPTFIVHKASGAGTFGQTEAAGTLKVGSLANDNTETNLVTWNATDKVLEYRTVASLPGGGITRSILTTAVNTTALAVALTDYVYLVSNTTTITMPTASGNTNRYTIKNVDTGNVTINTTSSQTMDGSLTILLRPNQAVDLIASSTSTWAVI